MTQTTTLKRSRTRKPGKATRSPCHLVARSPRHPVTLPACHDSEVELMLRVQQDEPGAFAELVEKYWTQVFGRFFRQLGDRQEAEDLAQEVFLRLYRSRRRYQPRAKFTTWLFHIAQNVTRNALRSKRRRPLISMGNLTGSETTFRPRFPEAERNETPSVPMERAELADVVHAAVAELGGRQRLALELFQFQDRSCGEIAEEMDMSPKAARSLLYRARNQLRVCLTTYLEM